MPYSKCMESKCNMYTLDKLAFKMRNINSFVCTFLTRFEAMCKSL